MPTSTVYPQPLQIAVSVDVNLADRTPAAPTPDRIHYQTRSAVLVDPWVVMDGKPAQVPDLGIAAQSSLGIGSHHLVIGQLAPAAIGDAFTGDARWLAEDYLPGGEGWAPRSNDPAAEWMFGFGTPTFPVVDLGYSYALDDDEYQLPAVVLDGLQYVDGASLNWLTTYTICFVVMLHPAREAILWSTYAGPGVDPGRALLYLIYDDRKLRLHNGVNRVLAEHAIRAEPGRPIGIAITVDGPNGWFYVTESDRTADDFYDETLAPQATMGMEFGFFISGGGMDIFEVGLWYDRAADAGELEAWITELDHVYGLMP